MTEQEKAELAAVVGFAAFVSLGGLGWYLHVLHIERKKRKRIEAWRLENLRCIANAHTRLLNLTQSPDYTAEKFVKALDEEHAFLMMVRRQMLY